MMPPPIRVCHLISTLEVGGAEQMLCRLVGRMDTRRFSSEVVSLVDPGPLSDHLQALGVPVSGLGMTRGHPSPSGLVRLVRHLRRTSPDVLQTWLYHADLLGLVAGTIARVPHIVWNIRSTDMDMRRYRTLSGLTLRTCIFLSRLPEAVIVNSRAGRQHHERLGYRPKAWVRIPNGVDTEVFRPDATARVAVRAELGIPEDALVVGLVARVDPMKDQSTFMDAIDLLSSSLTDVRFLFVGEGTEPEAAGELQARIARSPAQERILGLGRRPDIPRLMAAMDVLTLSSAFGEGFPNVVAEAMACAVPCVVTDVGDAAALVDGCGVVVPPSNARALADGLRQVLELSSDGRADLGCRARARVADRFGIDEVARRYEALYYHLSSGTPLDSAGSS